MTAIAYAPVTSLSRLPNSLFQVILIEMSDQMGEHLGVRVGLELMSPIHQISLQGRKILDDAVVNQHDALASSMRVVAFTGLSMSGPTRVGDPQSPVETILGGDLFLQDPDAAGGLRQLHAIIENRDTGGVIPPVFETFETLYQEISGLLAADICNDATHGYL